MRNVSPDLVQPATVDLWRPFDRTGEGILRASPEDCEIVETGISTEDFTAPIPWKFVELLDFLKGISIRFSTPPDRISVGDRIVLRSLDQLLPGLIINSAGGPLPDWVLESMHAATGYGLTVVVLRPYLL